MATVRSAVAAVGPATVSIAAGPAPRAGGLLRAVRIRPLAATLNPIDVDMLHGYGRRVLAPSASFVLGRDGVGVVEEVAATAMRVRRGDLVAYALDPRLRGTGSESVVAPEGAVARIPPALSADPRAAAGLGYAALSGHRAVFGLGPAQRDGVLVHGGTGGVGLPMIQMLLHENPRARVSVTCGARGRQVLANLGLDARLAAVVDARADPEWWLQVEPRSVSLLVDTVGVNLQDPASAALLDRVRPGGTVVTMRSPLLVETDRLGLVAGTAAAVARMAAAKAHLAARHGLRLEYALFKHNGPALESMLGLAAEGVIHTPIDPARFVLDSTADAVAHFEAGHNVGKVVVDITT